MKAITEPYPPEHHAAIKSGNDAHAKWFYVGRQLDGATPASPAKQIFGLSSFPVRRRAAPGIDPGRK